MHRATIAVALSATYVPAIQLKAMPSYRELLQDAKASIEEVDARRAQELLEDGDAPLLVDVRERDEWEQGRIPGAVHVPRGHLESRIEGVAPDRSRPVLLYCAAGNRSAFAARTLSELGYERTISLAGGYTDWQRSGFPTDLPRSLGPERSTRYSRHLLIPEVGEEGQLRLLDSRILLIGAGGLGSPASLYLAAAGVGKLGIGDPLVGRLLLYDALSGEFDEMKLRRDPACPVCGESPTITDYVDYVEFCSGGGH